MPRLTRSTRSNRSRQIKSRRSLRSKRTRKQNRSQRRRSRKQIRSKNIRRNKIGGSNGRSDVKEEPIFQSVQEAYLEECVRKCKGKGRGNGNGNPIYATINNGRSRYLNSPRSNVAPPRPRKLAGRRGPVSRPRDPTNPKHTIYAKFNNLSDFMTLNPDYVSLSNLPPPRTPPPIPSSLLKPHH